MTTKPVPISEDVLTPKLLKRFWVKVQKSEGDGCWLWTARRQGLRRKTSGGSGYGMFDLTREGGQRVVAYAHRLSYVIHFGEVPDGMCVCHTCDNPPCVRPDHLFLGTVADNVADMHKKNRHPRRCNRKLTMEDATKIRQLKADGMTLVQIGELYGVTKSTVSYVVNGRTWGKLKEIG